MAGVVKVGQITDGASTVTVERLAKASPSAYVVMDTTGANINVKSQFNVTSVSDLGVGQFTLNFANPMPSANYYVIGGTLSDGNNGGGSLLLRVSGAYNSGPANKTPNSVDVRLWAGSGLYDSKDLYVLVGGGG